MATQQDYQRLRLDIGATIDSLDDTEAEDVLTEAAETYSGAHSSHAYARVIAIRRILISSSKMVNYRQNNTQVNASDIFKNLREMLSIWENVLASSLAADSEHGVVRSGKTRRVPLPMLEYPDA